MIVSSGMSADDEPYVNLDPEHEELEKRMCDEIRKHGRMTVRLRRGRHLVLGEDEYLYL